MNETDPPDLPDIPADQPLPNPDELDWPAPPADDAEARKLHAEKIRDARIEIRKERAKSDSARLLEETKAAKALDAEFHKAIFDVAKGSIDRARAGADLVQKGAIAIATAYTALLGLAFAVGERPLPLRGLIAFTFLALAIVLASAYLSYLNKPRDVPLPEPESSPLAAAMANSTFFILWTRAGALQRGYALRASVIALAVALAFLPAPFITIEPEAATGESEEVAWPGIPAASDDPELQKILYTAKVTEAVERRKEARTAEAEAAEAQTSETQTARAGPKKVSWPKLPGSGDNPELDKILYTAEVAEAGELREQARDPIGADAKGDVWLLGALAGLLLVVLGPGIISGLGKLFGLRPPEDDSDVPKVPGPTVAQ